MCLSRLTFILITDLSVFPSGKHSIHCLIELYGKRWGAAKLSYVASFQPYCALYFILLLLIWYILIFTYFACIRIVLQENLLAAISSTVNSRKYSAGSATAHIHTIIQTNIVI